jgi:oligopeptide transport system ATP-binding protein
LVSKILEVEDLRTRFHTQDGTIYAVNGVSFHVEQGETLGIVGESGCGKSVSMLSVMGLIPQPPGEIHAKGIFFNGRNLMQIHREEMRKVRGAQIAMIYQDPMTSLNPLLTVGFQIMEAMRVHQDISKEEAHERAKELLHLVGIPDARERLGNYPHQFSGGMRQRAMIAMALSCDPALLIADEPTTALDVTIQAQIIELVKRLRNSLGMSLIWITHDLGIIAGLADRVAVMYAGFIVEEAPIEQVYGDPRHPYTRALLQSLPRMDSSPGEKLIPIDGMPPDQYEPPEMCPFAPRCIFVKHKCRDENPTLREIEPEHNIACWVDIGGREVR